jgi:hypothetical protein
MPRSAKGARLWLQPEERNLDGTLRKRAGAAADRVGAERAPGERLAEKYQPSRIRGRHPAEILIADVLAIYLTDVAPRHAREDENQAAGLGVRYRGRSSLSWRPISMLGALSDHSITV